MGVLRILLPEATGQLGQTWLSTASGNALDPLGHVWVNETALSLGGPATPPV